MKKFNEIDSWIDNVAYSHSKSPGTAIQYKQRLTAFLEFIGKSIAEILEDYKQIDEKEFKRTYAQYLKAYISNLSRSNLTPNTINSRVTAIKSFFKYSDLPIGFVPQGNGRVIFHNRDIQTKEVQAILAASRPRERAFFAMMAQGGLRPDTLMQLQLRDLEPEFSNFTPDKKSCLIVIPIEETKGDYKCYKTFIGEESVRYLKAYFNSERPNIQPSDLIFSSHSHGSDKPCNTNSISAIFARTLRHLKANKELTYEQGAKTKPSQLRLYTLRKYFRRLASPAGPDFVNYWMGHLAKLGTDGHYFSDDAEFQRAQYNKFAQPHLRLEASTAMEMDKEKTKEVEALNKQVAALTETVEILKNTTKNQWKTINEQAATPEQTIKLNTLARLIKQQLDSSGMSVEAFVESLIKKSDSNNSQ
jgi:integrase